MMDYIWSILSPAQKTHAQSMLTALRDAFRGFSVPDDISHAVLQSHTIHQEVIIVRDLLGLHGWESVDSVHLLQHISSGVAVVNLCDILLYPYYAPLFMTVAIDERCSCSLDQIYVESIVCRMLGDSMDWNAYNNEQAKASASFIVFCVLHVVPCSDSMFRKAMALVGIYGCVGERSAHYLAGFG
jgi:hypothetical protein